MSFLSRKITDLLMDKLQKPRKGKEGLVILPKFLAIIGAAGSLFFLILAAVFYWKGEGLGGILVFLFFSALSGSLILAYFNCRITYDETGFWAKNFLGIKRHFTYDQITGIRRGVQETHLYVGKHHYMVDKLSVGGSEFLIFANSRYRTMHNNRPIPEIHRAKVDLFRGNIRNPGNFLFAYILMGSCCIGFLIFLICTAFLPSTPENTVEQALYFSSCRIEDRNIVLISSNPEEYRISFFDEETDLQGIRAVCDGQTPLTVYSKRMDPDDGEPWYSVRAILSRDKTILSFDEADRLRRQEYWPLPLFGFVFCLLWAAYVIGSIVVGRNPKKYSKRTVRLFFKDDYVK